MKSTIFALLIITIYERTICIFSCYLDGRQLCSGDTSLLPAREVLRTIFDADAESVCRQVALTIGNAISNASYKYGWIARIDKYAPGDPDDVNYLISAVEYVEDKVNFRR